MAGQLARDMPPLPLYDHDCHIPAINDCHIPVKGELTFEMIKWLFERIPKGLVCFDWLNICGWFDQASFP